MTNAIVTINGARPACPTLLGNGPARIPVGGKIRAGIKVLTKKAAESPAAKDIYERGVAASHSFEEIERAIYQAAPNLQTPLIPKNVAWFTVRPNDFPNPEIARQILDAFGEDRGDGVQRLYRFPVIFPADAWQAVMPHELVAWGAHERKFWSDYSADGRTRYCKCYAPVPMASGGKRAIRLFGGRKTMLRPENDGICNPEGCPEFQSRQCNLSGRFIFFIPGIKSIDAFELHTNSFYAMSKAIEQFETLAFMRGGRISGFLDNKSTPFYLTKKLRDVPYVDEEGKAVRTTHWIIELEAPIDVTALLRANDDDSATQDADEAARVLEGARSGGRSGSDDPGVVNMETSEIKNDKAATDAGCGKAAMRASQAGDQQSVPTAASQTADAFRANRKVSPGEASISVEQVLAAAGEFGISAAHYEEYAAKRWGTGWKLNANGRRRALDEIERYTNDPEGLVDKIDVELQACS